MSEMMGQRHEKMWAELAPYYDVIYQWKDYGSESRRIEELIRKHRKSPGRSLLDVACGTGGYLQYLRKRFKATGIDASQQMLREARKKCPGAALRQADMMSFQRNSRFDAIKISRLNVSRRRGNVAILDFHFLVATKSGVRHLRDLHELGLFEVKTFLEHLQNAGLRARFLKNGLMKDRGLYLAVKR